MTRTLTVEVTTTRKTAPAGRRFAVRLFELRFAGSALSTPYKVVRTVDPFANFAGLDDGAYSVTVTDLDDAGGVLGTPVAADTTVGVPPGDVGAEYDATAAISFSVV